MINPYYFDKKDYVAYNNNLDIHQINHTTSNITITPANFFKKPDIENLVKQKSNINAGTINKEKYKYQSVFPA